MTDQPKTCESPHGCSHPATRVPIQMPDGQRLRLCVACGAREIVKAHTRGL